LTDAGLDLVPKLETCIRSNNARFLAGVSAREQAVFIEIIKKMLKNADYAVELESQE